MYLANRKLEYYSGDYDNFLRVKAENDESARKKIKADQKKLKKIKENLGRTGVQAKQAKSHEKALMKRKEKDGGAASMMTEEEIHSLLGGDKQLNISFQKCGGGLPSPFLKFNDVSFAYPGRDFLYRDLNFGLDLNSRIAIVGPKYGWRGRCSKLRVFFIVTRDTSILRQCSHYSGGGKSTLMKLMCGQLEATSGVIYRHHHMRIARFHQHLTEQLDLDVSAVEWMCGRF